MKTAFAFFGIAAVLACNEPQGNNIAQERAANVNGSSPAMANETRTEKFYGIDFEGDTIVYEQDGQVLNSGVVTGTFERLERGDFMHFVVRDSNALLHRFFIYLANQQQMDKYHDGYEPARGHPVTVKWIRAPLPIGEHGAPVMVYQAKEIYQ